MSEDEKTCRSAIDNLWRGRPWGVAMRREANRALDRLIAAARAEGFARAREMAAQICDCKCGSPDPDFERREGRKWHSMCCTVQYAERIRAMQDEGAHE